MYLFLATLLCFASSIFADEECPSREDCMECVMKYCDVNNDMRIDLEEIYAAKARYLTWYERVLAWGTGQSAERMLQLCDYDKDGFISHDDFVNSEETCLSDCFKRKLFYNKICTPAAGKEFLEEQADLKQ